MNRIPQSERVHIVVVGRRNVGKSSLVNELIGQEISIVSDVAGTTTDPVKKAVELLPYGPVVITDTAGIDDVGELGSMRVSKTIKTLSSADFALLVIDANQVMSKEESVLINYLRESGIPFLIALNKAEAAVNRSLQEELFKTGTVYFEVSCRKKTGIDILRRKLIEMLPSEKQPLILDGIVNKGDTVLLVVPIDRGAPKERIILPQVQTLRHGLDNDNIVIVVKDTELTRALGELKNPPSLVITDSQAIGYVNSVVPENIRLTTFSILMARYKGELSTFINGIKRIEELKDGDRILIAEACTHHPQSDDIGRIKIPDWLYKSTGKKIQIDIKSGQDFPENLSVYRLIIHCGGCMLTRKTMLTRIKAAKLMNVPIINYGLLISYIHNAIPRVLIPFEEAMNQWSKREIAMSGK